MPPLTILHTSDWHLGHQLYKKRRDSEFSDFLDWLLQALAENHVDVLLVAGDVFDNGAPAIGAQKLYYDFIARLPSTGVRHMVIVAGNHDSPAFLTAAGSLLDSLHVHVVGTANDNPEDEIKILRNARGEEELIVCAVPFLRERDVREFRPGESWEERSAAIQSGIAAHYNTLAKLAAKRLAQCSRKIPVIATGHLFAAGGINSREDGMRDLYVGNLGCVPAEIFPDIFDYVALGHIHKPMPVGAYGHVRYCGTPLPMSFAEASREHQMILCHWDGEALRREILPVPVFRHLERLYGNRESILRRLEEMALEQKDNPENIWLEIQHDGSDSTVNFSKECEDLTSGTNLEILCIKAAPQTAAPLDPDLDRGLEDINPEEIFQQMLKNENVANDRWPELLSAFRELVSLHYAGEK